MIVEGVGSAKGFVATDISRSAEASAASASCPSFLKLATK
jgi:hypothetical protein